MLTIGLRGRFWFSNVLLRRDLTTNRTGPKNYVHRQQISTRLLVCDPSQRNTDIPFASKGGETEPASGQPVFNWRIVTSRDHKTCDTVRCFRVTGGEFTGPTGIHWDGISHEDSQRQPTFDSSGLNNASECVKMLGECLSLGGIEHLQLDLRNTRVERDGVKGWQELFPSAMQHWFFTALARNSRRRSPCARRFPAVKSLRLLLRADPGYSMSLIDGKPATAFDAGALQNGLGEFFEHAPQLQQLEVFWGKFYEEAENDSLEGFVWQPLSNNQLAMEETLTSLFVVGGNLDGLDLVLASSRKLERLVVFDWENEMIKKGQYQSDRWSLPPRDKDDEDVPTPIGERAFHGIRTFLGEENGKTLRDLTLSPAVFHE